MAVFEFFNQFVLVGLAVFAEELERIGLGDVFADQCFLALHQFLHFLFDFGEVVFADGNSRGGHHVVVEAVFDGGSDAELGARPEFLHGFGHEVGRSMPEGVLALFIVPLVEVDGGIAGDGAVEFDSFAVHAAGQHVLCQAL